MSKLERWLPFMFKRNKAAQTTQAEPETRAEPAAIQPTTASYDPFGDMTRMSNLMGRMLEGFHDDPFFRTPLARFSELDRWFGDFSPQRFRPTVDVVDEEAALRVSAELPGLDKDDVQVFIDDDVLVLRGEKRNVDESTERGIYRSERFYGSFQRAIPLPGDVDREGVEARYQDGVLTVRLPKRPQSGQSQRQVAVKG